MQREQVQRTVRIPSKNNGKAQTRNQPLITATVRVNYPPGTDHKTVAQAVLAATSSVLEALETDGGWLLLGPVGVGPS